WKTASSLCAHRLARAAHQRADLLAFGVRWQQLFMWQELAFIEYSDAVGEHDNLVEIGRDQEYSRAFIGGMAKLLVDELRGGDIKAARRVGGQNRRVRKRQRARDDELLLIAAAQLRRRRVLLLLR